MSGLQFYWSGSLLLCQGTLLYDNGFLAQCEVRDDDDFSSSSIVQRCFSSWTFCVPYETQYWFFKELDWNFDYDCIEYLDSFGKTAICLKIFLSLFTYLCIYFYCTIKSLVWLQTLQGILYYLRLVKCVVSEISLLSVSYCI